MGERTLSSKPSLFRRNLFLILVLLGFGLRIGYGVVRYKALLPIFRETLS